LQLLEEVCKVFGWTCRVKGDTFYFEANTDNDLQDWLSINNRDLYDIATGREDESEVVPRTTLQSLPSDFESTDNKLTVVRGWHKSSVIAKINKIDSIIEYPADEIEKYYHSNIIDRTRPIDTNGLWLFEKVPITSDMQFNFKKVTMQLREYTIVGPAPNYPVPAYGAIHVFSYTNTENPHTVSFKNPLVIWREKQNIDPLFKMTSKNPYWMSDGIIVLSAKTFSNYIEKYQTPSAYNPYDGIGTLECSLKIGNKYWNGMSWTTNEATFYVSTGTENKRVQQHGEGQIKNEKLWNDRYPDFDGTKITVPGNVGGYITFAIHGFKDGSWEYPDETPIWKYCECNLVGLKLEFIRKDSEELLKEATENKYIISRNDTPFSEEKTIELLFFTDNNNQYAENVIFNEDGTYCQQMTIGGVAQHPEQHLVNRMAAWGAQTHDVLSFETTTNDGAGTITPMHVVQSGGKTYSPISISRDWRDDVMKIKYIEMLPTT
jgi:hypothetical protein